MRTIPPALQDKLDAGATTLCGNTGARNDERMPSAGAGPGSAFKASRFATAEFDLGRSSLGASATVSRGVLPRATRIVWVG